MEGMEASQEGGWKTIMGIESNKFPNLHYSQLFYHDSKHIIYIPAHKNIQVYSS